MPEGKSYKKPGEKDQFRTSVPFGPYGNINIPAPKTDASGRRYIPDTRTREIIRTATPQPRAYEYGYGSLQPRVGVGKNALTNPEFLSELNLLNREYQAAFADYQQRRAIEDYQTNLQRYPVQNELAAQQAFAPRGQTAIGEVYGGLQQNLQALLPQVTQPYETAAAGQQQITGEATGAISGQLQTLQDQLAAQAAISGTTAPVGALSGLELALQQQQTGGAQNLAGIQQMGAQEQALAQQAIGGYGTEQATRQGYLQDQVAAEIANLQAELQAIQPSPVPFNIEDVNIRHERGLRDLLKYYTEGAGSQEEQDYQGQKGIEDYFKDIGTPELTEDFMDRILRASLTAQSPRGRAQGTTLEEAFYADLTPDLETLNRNAEFEAMSGLAPFGGSGFTQTPGAKRSQSTISKLDPEEYLRLLQTALAIYGGQYQ